MRMPQIMAEAFARGLVDKIMVEVLSVIDRDTQDGKARASIGAFRKCNSSLNSNGVFARVSILFADKDNYVVRGQRSLHDTRYASQAIDTYLSRR